MLHTHRYYLPIVPTGHVPEPAPGPLYRSGPGTTGRADISGVPGAGTASPRLPQGEPCVPAIPAVQLGERTGERDMLEAGERHAFIDFRASHPIY